MTFVAAVYDRRISSIEAVLGCSVLNVECFPSVVFRRFLSAGLTAAPSALSLN